MKERFTTNKIDLTLVSSALCLLILQGCASQGPSNDKTKLSEQAAPNDNILEIERAQKAAKLDKVPDAFTICSVNDVPITMGDYRRQLKTQQQKVQTALAMYPQTKAELLQIAAERKISLTAQEKKEMLDRTKAFQSGGKQAFSKFLQENKATKAQFDAQVLEMGLACKASKEIIEQNLLRQLINRELLASAAKSNGMSKQALNKYLEIKKTPQYEQLVQESGMSAEQIENELIKSELCSLMLAKIRSEAAVGDSETRKFYEENKARLTHGPRVRLSQIVIAAPAQDIGPIESVKTQMRKANPKTNVADIEKQAQALIESQKQKAESLLEQARNGANFTDLANHNTEDGPARQNQNGGDIGLQEDDKLVPSFRKELASLKIGEVDPRLVKTSLGFHIFKLTSREPAGPLSYDECKEQIKKFLAQQKEQQVIDKWFKEQRRLAKVNLSSEFQALIASVDQSNKEKKIATP